MKLMILDGNSVINRAFYGVRPLTTRDGLYTTAIYGFLNILEKLRADEKPDALCVAFDLKAPRGAEPPPPAASFRPAATPSLPPTWAIARTPATRGPARCLWWSNTVVPPILPAAPARSLSAARSASPSRWPSSRPAA